MKNKIIFSCFIIVLLVGCHGEIIDWLPPKDSIAPGTVSNVQVENLPGAARITYDLPDDEDLLAVEAVYTINGKEWKSSASAYTDTLTVEGFGSTDPQIIQIYCLDRSMNYSEAVNVEIHPLTPPVTSIFESIKMDPTFGGVSLRWDNPTKANVSVWILAEDSTGIIREKETVYTNSSSGRFALRGYEPEEKTFGAFVRDHWDNISDTLYAQLTPFEETKIDPAKFHPFPLVRDIYLSYQFYYMFDGNLWEGLYSYIEVTLTPVFFTFDLGAPVRLNRYILWHRLDLAYQDYSPKRWKIYGALDPDLSSSDTEYWETGYQKDWTLLSEVDDFSLYKPSGNERPITDEDMTAARNGFEMDCINSDVAVRYLRFEIPEGWSAQGRVVIGELEFYGVYVK